MEISKRNPCAVVTHRGLEPSSPQQFAESSRQAFSSQLSRGFGLEFDPCILKDGSILITHASSNQNGVSYSDLSAEDIKNGPSAEPDLLFINEIFELISRSAAPLHALHFKGKFQNQSGVEILSRELKRWNALHPRILVFDLKPETAVELRKQFPALRLAPSAADPFDIERYGACVGGTLLTIDQVIELRSVFDWVWLDEWDLSGSNGIPKEFYSAENFSKLRAHGFKLALVTPELHATSPGLLGGESHPDAANKERLLARCCRILQLRPDAVCTDYPEELRRITKE